MAVRAASRLDSLKSTAASARRGIDVGPGATASTGRAGAPAHPERGLAAEDAVGRRMMADPHHDQRRALGARGLDDLERRRPDQDLDRPELGVARRPRDLPAHAITEFVGALAVHRIVGEEHRREARVEHRDRLEHGDDLDGALMSRGDRRRHLHRGVRGRIAMGGHEDSLVHRSLPRLR